MLFFVSIYYRFLTQLRISGTSTKWNYFLRPLRGSTYRESTAFWKTIAIFEISALQFALWQSLVQKQKFLNFRPKCLICVFLGWHLKIILSYLKSAPSNFVNYKISWKNRNRLNRGPKNALFGYFWTRTFKNYCHIWNQHPRICLVAKFCEKTKLPKSGTKNILFGYFWARICK